MRSQRWGKRVAKIVKTADNHICHHGVVVACVKKYREAAALVWYDALRREVAAAHWTPNRDNQITQNLAFVE